MAWEIKGTVGSLESLPNITYQSKVSAPKNPKLIKENKKILKFKPSEFLREMSMDTKQKLASTNEMYLPKIIELLDMGETSLQKNTQLVVDEPMFQPYPSEIYYQKFDPFNVYEVPLLLRNNDKVPRLVKVTQVDTPYFKIITSSDAHQKVGPGLPVIYKIQFMPEENKDYNHELIVSTEREKFIIPIKCIGSRGILDFPDEINFSMNTLCPVKYLNSKVLLIRNIGNKDAKFSFKVEKPFSIQPDHGVLPVGENMQVTVDFQPLKSGEFKKDLVICYDSNELVYVTMYGASQDINVRLDKNSLRIEDTYITMTNQRTVTIHNRSDIIVHYEWKKFATIEEEEQQKLKELATLSRDEENAKNKLSNQSPDYIALLSRNFQNKTRNSQNKPFHFDDNVFLIQPIEGDIWPNSTCEVSIIFRPDFAQTYNKTAYCEVTGRESRLPLRLSGIGSGPKVQLSIENLEIGNVFIGSTHVFEVVLANKGFIDAIYSVNIPNTAFGKFFSFEPNEGLISPNSYQAVSISFGSNKLGDFSEVFEFAVDGKLEKYKMTISGSIIPPTFKFDTDKIRFNQVSYGFKYSHNCVLKNTSLVPMTFSLRVASDSESSNHNVKEFSIKPNTGTILPQSDTKILLEFVPSFIKKYETNLVVDIEDVATELLLLPITARSGVPNINLLTNNVDMGRCFIYYPYEKYIKLSNESTLRARYSILPSDPSDVFKFTSNQAEGVIEPNTIKEICIIAEAVQLNEIECDLLIKINGSPEPPIKCHFTALCQGPVVLVSPRDLDWGQTTVLIDSCREILITNESLIEAKFSTSMIKKHSPWRIEPQEGLIEPGSEIVLKAICHLIDKIKYEDVIVIDIQHSSAQHINVRAIGGGCSIVSEPHIGTLVDFGTYFSGGTVRKVFKLTNKSSRFQSLSFLPDGRNSTTLNKKELLKEKAKNIPPMIFKVIPTRLELVPGETKEIVMEGYGAKPQLVEELLTCFSIIGKTSGKDRIMKFKIKCEFIAPLVSFSARDLIFRCEHDGNEVQLKQYRSIIISNVSSLDVTSHMNLASPFFLVDQETGCNVSELQANIKTGESLQIKVLFDTSFKDNLHNEIINRMLTICYAEHQHNDMINLTGEIYFPNVHIETNLVDFGCILNNTEVFQDVKITNIGPLIVNYKWKFVYETDNIVANYIKQDDALSKQISSHENLFDIELNNSDGVTSPGMETIPTTDDLSQSTKPTAVKPADIDLPSIEEIFDISPLYGTLHPGESQKLRVNYFGHKEIKAYVRAICEIKNGPNYEMMIKGEASVLNYEISDYTIHFDYIPFDEVAESFITIKNLGKVNIEYSMVGIEAQEANGSFQIEPEKPMLMPPRGYIEAENSATISLQYLPGIPRKFVKKMLIQVSHFAPEEVIVSGEAGFIDLMLDLPRWETEFYQVLLKEAIDNLKINVEQIKAENEIGVYQSNTPELDLQIELDRLSIQKHVQKLLSEQKKDVILKSDLIASNKSLTQTSAGLLTESSHKKYSLKSIELPASKIDDQSFTNLPNTIGTVSRAHSHTNKTIDSSRSAIKRRIKPVLPDYLLDFGHVILGTVKTHVIRAANMGKLLASFEIERQNFSKTGFLIDLEKVKNLPNEESVEFVVTFDPRGANLGLGLVEHIIPINIINGPIVNIRLKANVTMPDLQISSDVVDFGEVKCGECKIITVQLNNYKEVRCDWSASYLPKKEDKFTPMHLKRKKKAPNGTEHIKPHIFEIMPPTGILLANQKVNIQLKFMPTEEKLQEERVTIRMAQSSQRLMILCKGKGLEPRLDFSKNSIEFEPILPHSPGDEQEVKIVNPCPFPVELYNLEFDKNYLEEEKILRVIRGYDEFNTILLPPRFPGDKLPVELYDYFDDLSKKLDEEEKKQKQLLNESLNQREMNDLIGRQAAGSAITEKSKTEDTPNKSSTSRPVGDVEKNPVFDSIAQYLGIDLSSEGRAARNRRGVAIIINGPPLSGKSRSAVALAKYYECALLTIDSIVTDAIANSSSAAAARVRQLCADTAAKHAEESRAQEALEQSKMALNNHGGLSIEALAQHSISQAGGGGFGGSKKTSVAGDSHTNVKNVKKGKQDVANPADQSSNHPSTPPPLLAPIARKLSISTHLYSHDDGYMSTVLPEDLIVDLLSERFQLSDCNRGVVIDGLDTLFAQNYLLAASAVLKAFNNRRYIYCFTMKSDFKKYLEQQHKILEEKLKAEKEKELQEKLYFEEMDEETYMQLPEEKRKEIDEALLETKKQRLKKDAEEKAATERERIEREQAEQAKLEEEKKKKKGGKPNTGKDSVAKAAAVPATATHKAQAKDIKEAPKATEKGQSGQHNPNHANNRPETRAEEEIEKSKVRVGTKMAGAIGHPHEEEQPQVKEEKKLTPEEEKKREAEKLLQQRFKTFDLYSKEIVSLMELWDRSQGSIFRQPSPSEKSEHDDHSNKKNAKNVKGAKEKEVTKDQKKEKEKTTDIEKPIKTEQSNETADNNEDVENQGNTTSSNYLGDKVDKEESVGVPHIYVEVNDKAELDDLYKHPRLPLVEDVLDGMGMGPKGPPIPPPAIFSVVPYPVHRKSPPGAEFSHYVFVTTNENDPNLIMEESKPKDSTQNESVNLEGGEKTPDNSKESKGSLKPQRTPKAGASRNDNSSSRAEDKRRTSGEKRSDKRSESRVKRDGNAASPNRGSSSLSGNQKDDNQDGLGSIDGSLDKPSQKLQRFRWIIPQNSELTIRLRFTSEEIGQFDQTLNFEVVGTRRRYQLHCRGVCTFPTISREPRIVFPNKKKIKEKNEIVSKKFILADDVFEFGPLLVGNNKERCREGKFPEYQENLTIHNSSPLDVDVSFCFLDENAEKNDGCFFMEPNEMSLKPNETKFLKLFATPKESRMYEDTLICCVKENPEPITFRLSCLGQKPELVLDKKEFNFKQVLLHRKESKDIKMTNNTLLPVQWRIEGSETLGDEFICNQTSGVIEPNESFNLILHFRAIKPLTITAKEKKILKVLVSSVNSFLGFMENHVITVLAEAYDVALEINLPKGNDGGLDFGSIRVNSESKLNCTLKNKGKYPIKFNFITEAISPETTELLKYITISPAFGELPSAHDRNTQNQTVTVSLIPKKMILIKDAPVLKCQITEPSSTDGPAIIANIPIKVTAKAVVSEFNIVPHAEVNFGPLSVNSKRQEKIVIENKGELDFKFTISKYTHSLATRDGVQNQGRLQVGIYTITPAFAIILQNGHQVITIDCAPEQGGKFEEDIVFDITDRNMQKYPNGITYKLNCEAVMPIISNSIEMFEEHTIIPNLLALNPKMMGVGIYSEEENKFFFNNVIVGRTAKARFKFFNSNKIPIDLNVALKSPNKTNKAATDSTFEIEPQRIQITSFGFAYVTVSFNPTSMTSYSTYIEANLENTPNSIKPKPVTFEIIGEGNLPRFTIVKPSLRNKKGQSLMLFKRCVVKTNDTQQMVLLNEGTLATKVNFFLFDPDMAFKFKALNANEKDSGIVMKEGEDVISSVIIQPNTQVSFQVTCTPKRVQTYQASLQLTVTDNQFEDTFIQMIGEGYMEDVIFENLHSLAGSIEADEEVLADEDVAAMKCNSISFGDVYINDKKQLLFTMKNQSKSDCYRFEWPTVLQPFILNNASAATIGGLNTSVNTSSANIILNETNNTSQNTASIVNETQNAAIQFSPRIGHLHAGCAKDITVTFKSFEPKQMKKELFTCNLTKIAFEQQINEIKDWDDRLSQVKWVNDTILVPSVLSSVNADQINSSLTFNQQRQLTELGANLPGAVSSAPIKQTIRRKVIETEPEPKHIKIDEQTQPMELYISANCDYCKYKCRTNVIRFKDTLMFQTRVYEVLLVNRGKIQFDYNWRVIMEDSRRPFTPMIQPGTPTPESSASPRGRKGKGGYDSSPSRKANGGKDSMGKDQKGKDKDAGGKGSIGGAKKGPQPAKETPVEAAETNKSRGGPSRKGKTQDKSDLEDSMAYNKKSSDLMEASLRNADISDLGTSRTIDEGQLGRPESQMMRAESSLSHHAPSSISESGYIPFLVEPNFGKIEPGKSQTFKVKFAPLNVNDYQARVLCQIPNTEDGKVGPMIAVKGRGLLPYCHMELEESDYITAGRRDPDLPGPSGAASGIGLDPNTKVIEFSCIGLETKASKKFEMINPTNADYNFEWVKEDQNDAKKHDQFTCLVPSGTLTGGKKFDITFEFEPNSLETQESFWKFRIPKYDLTVPFLLVGHVSEPKVLFERSHITLKPLLVGKQGRDTVNLINQENHPLKFQFDQASCYTEGRSAVVIVEPAFGTLEPNSKLSIYLTFQPREQRSHTFNIKCKVNHMSKPLNLNVKGEGFQIQTSLYCEDTYSGNKIEFVDNSINEIHMGEVEKNETCFRNLFIFNSGKHTANFEWVLSSQYEDALSCFSIEPLVDQVEPGDKKHCVLKYVAKFERSTIANMILKVENGSIYHIHLDGIGVRPDLYLSFSNYDFGPCFIYKAGMKLKQVDLQLTNRGNKDLNISCVNNETNIKNSCFQFDFKQIILQPNKSVTTQICFIPRECKAYSEQIILELNGLTRREIFLTGVGAQLKIELTDPKQKCFDVGTLQVNKQIQKKLQIINRSIAPIDFNLLFEPRSEYLARDYNALKIEPSQNISLRAGQTQDLLVKFSPKYRIPKFIEDLNIEYNGINLPLCTLQGACHGYNIWLDMYHIPFGAVSQKCSTVKRLVMHNDGDIGASFKWDLEKMKPEFSIYPVVGYISPGMEVKFDITYNPTELTSDLRKDNVKCFIEGMQPILLTLTGSCVQVVAQKETHNFDTFVRQKDTKQITISNRSNIPWEIKPLIEGEYFSGLESFTVECQSTSSFEISYFPMTMTQNNGPKHTGSIFFPLPDGTGILYNLVGTSNPPKPIGKVVREIPCKTSFTEVLPVENWLKKPQRFKVNFEIIKPEKADTSTTIKGNDYIDVPGSGKKDYKLNYFAHKENTTIFKVVFKNEQTSEYSFYEMSFKSFKGSSLGTIDLTTQVRVPVSHSIKLENPLANMVTFNASCSNTTEVLIPSSLSIIGKGQGEFNFEFLPLKAGESNSKLELTSTDLGTNVYDLNLKAIAAASERPIIFKTSLGNSQALVGKIVNFCRQKTEYTCKVDNADFKVDKTITAAPSQNPSGLEVSFEILFEPSSLGDIRASLILSSTIGGDYLIPLIGTCLPPKPQGPFTVKSNTNTSVSFKNVFSSALTFSFAIDNPLFHVSKTTETLKPHQIYKITVGFDGNDGPNKADVMAKLVVTAPKSAGVSNNIQWIFYLKGTS